MGLSVSYQVAYNRTKNGKLVRTYNNMKNRIKGTQPKPYYYIGLELMCKEDFYKFSMKDEGFNRLFDAWEESGFDLLSSPSIDRIKEDIGYVVDNIRWVSQSDNSKKGNIDVPF